MVMKIQRLFLTAATAFHFLSSLVVVFRYDRILDGYNNGLPLPWEGMDVNNNSSRSMIYDISSHRAEFASLNFHDDLELVRFVGKGEISYGFEALMSPNNNNNQTVMVKIATDRDLHYSNVEIDAFQRLRALPTIPTIPKIHGIIPSMKNPFCNQSAKYLRKKFGLSATDADALISKRRTSIIAMDFLSNKHALPTTLVDLRRYLRSLLETLEFAHARNVMHLDLHAGNVFWDGEIVHLFDWNAARIYDPHVPQRIGNRVPPEAHDDDAATHASVSAFDVYTVGLLLKTRILKHWSTNRDDICMEMAHRLADYMMIADPLSRPNATQLLQHPIFEIRIR